MDYIGIVYILASLNWVGSFRNMVRFSFYPAWGWWSNFAHQLAIYSETSLVWVALTILKVCSEYTPRITWGISEFRSESIIPLWLIYVEARTTHRLHDTGRSTGSWDSQKIINRIPNLMDEIRCEIINLSKVIDYLFGSVIASAASVKTNWESWF